MAVLDHLLGGLLEGRVLGQRHNIGARHHDLRRAQLVQLQDVGEQAVFVRVDRRFLLMLLDQLFELVMRGRRLRVAAAQMPEPLAQSRETDRRDAMRCQP